jgi:hypothetical protein
MRTAVLVVALALAALEAAGCAKHHGGAVQRHGDVEQRHGDVEQRHGGMEEIVRVKVFSDHYEIDGTRYDGALSAQLDRYADSSQRVAIVLMGSDPDVKARLPELAHLSRNSNVSISTITMRVAK